MCLVYISLLLLLVVQIHPTAVDTCRYHLQKAASKFCPNTTCVERAAVELAVDHLSDSLFLLFFNLDDFCCRRICTHEDLLKLCCDPKMKKFF